MQGTLTLPSLLLMERRPDDNPVQKYFERPREELLAEAVQAIRESDIPQESYEMARGFCAAALDALAVLPDDPARQALEDLTGYALERRS
jgi:heptaprenyl diphosphate synthase/octaprenyl-diphosphate synthase